MRFLAASLLCLLLALFLQKKSLVLADATRALPITIHPEAGPEVRFAAQDLARILGVMTGSTPEIRESSEPEGIVIGTAAQFEVFADDPGLEIRREFDGREAYIIRPDFGKGRLWILANRDDGAGHGVYSLLREQGYRAFFPGKNWEVIPKRKAVAIFAPSEGRPRVLTRQIWAGFGSFDKEQTADVEAWRRRNRLGASIRGSIGHSWESMIRHSQDLLEANPTLYAEKADGTLNRQAIRHGTQAAVDFTVGWFERQLRENKDPPDILSLAPTDGDNYSRDKETASRGEINESFYWYVNAVARRMLELAPDRLVGTTAYYLHAKPPPFALEPNVMVLAATMFGSGGLSLEDFFAVWSQKTPWLGIRDYIYSGYQFHADHPDGGLPRKALERRAEWLRNFQVSYFSAEGLWEWGLRGFDYYALAQLLWDPVLGVEAIFKDFVDSAYGAGPCAEAMMRYYQSLEPAGKMVRKFQMARGVRAIQEAAEAAAGNPGVLARIDDMKLFLIHAAWMDRMRALKKDDPERWKLVARDLEWNYRARRGYILNYNCNRRLWMVNAQQLGGFLSRDKNIFWPPETPKPTTPEEQDAALVSVLGDAWRLEGGRLAPRKGDTLAPPSAEEIRALFDQEVVPLYPEVAAEETAYSKDYVPVDMGAQADTTPGEALWFGASPKFLVWRPRAETLTATVTPNVRYPDRTGGHPLEITMEFPDGEAPQAIRLEQDGKPRPLTLDMPPLPGISAIAFNTRRMGLLLEGARWEYAALPTDAETIVFLKAAPRRHERSAQSVYFYVPKGIREIHACSDRPEALVKATRFLPPGGEPASVRIEGDILKIAVPEGADGRVWAMADGGPGVRFYFLNLPNLLFLHPGKILLPSEVAEKDGLKRADL